ncbi:MFS transporter [Streptomyces sp. NBC_00481]|uniref:caspase, EACC1-associated type n=1 Tax=Streptomyces sp. NBC_00481 TaxID=2975755 RepID=UPI002DDC0DEF|nr:MFS transporter [Streptomyces sp. NBC_00481]WRZ01215.1 MFS transporter [Streptomyces sp. NBC_00481]
MSSGGRFALLIATGEYDEPGLRRLRSPVRDADGLGEVLRDREIGDFVVQTVVDARHHEVNRAIEAFFRGRGRHDVLLLHISCHGVKSDNGELYFAARDTHRDLLASTAVSADFLRSQMTRCRAKSIVLLLDCCYSGAFIPGAKGDPAVYVQDELAGHGRAVLTATNRTEYAWEGDHLSELNPEPSRFTGAIIEGLRTGEADSNADGRVSVQDLYEYVCERLHAARVRQRPQMWAEWQYGVVVAYARPKAAHPVLVETARLPQAPGPGPQAGRGGARRLLLTAMCLAQLMVVFGASAVNIALPSLQDDLGLSQIGTGWIVNAYNLALASLLLAGHRAAARFGERRVFLAGALVFAASCLLSGAAQDAAQLNAARAAQGAAAALIGAAVLRVVSASAAPSDRARGLGLIAAVTSAGVLGADFLGGVVTALLGWRGVFLLPGAVSLALLATAPLLPRRRSGPEAGIGLGVLDALLFGAGMVCLTISMTGSGRRTWASVEWLTSLASGVALLTMFLLLGLKPRGSALIPSGAFRPGPSRVTVAVSALLGAALASEAFLVSFYLQKVLHYGPLEAGLVFLPPAVTTFTVSVLANRAPYGPRALLTAGLALLAVGLIWLGRAPDNFLPPLEVAAVGLGLVPGRLGRLAEPHGPEAACPPSGSIGELAHLAFLAGSALGLAFALGTAERHAVAALAALPVGLGREDALADGYGQALLASAMPAAAAALVPLLLPRKVRALAEKG